MTTEGNVSENFCSAYSNVGLLADDIWIFKSHIKSYKKANKDLWFRFNDIEQRLFEVSNKDDDDDINSSFEYPLTVRNVIPNSRLAQYGDFLYDDKRERLYTLDDTPAQYIPNDIFDNERELEVWMLEEVEEEFKRLTFVSSSRWCSSSPTLSVHDDISLTSVKENEDHTWLTSIPWPQVLLTRYLDLPRTLQDSNKSFFSDYPIFDDLNSFPEFEDSPVVYGKPNKKKIADFPLPRYIVSTNDELRLCIIHTSPSLQQIWDRPDVSIKSLSSIGSHVSKSLNAEVPEFQPTKKRNDFPPFYDFNYESDLFPYSETTITPNILPPMSCNMSCLSDSIGNMIPVYQRPPEFYSRPENITSHKKRIVGADLNNLIFLTQDEGISYSGLQPQALNSLQIIQGARQRLQENFPQLPQHPGQSKSSSEESCQEMLAQVNKWLDRVYPMRSSNFSDISSTNDKMDKLAIKVQNNYFPMKNPTQINLPVDQSSTLPEKPATKRRLYRDVLTSGCGCSDIENKFEELEREALEQYAGSDTNLIGTCTSINYTPSEDNMVTRRYQDLEREALEQYQGNGSQELNLNINGGEHFETINMDMIPVVKAPYPSSPSSIDRDSCPSQSSGNSQGEITPRGAPECNNLSSETLCLNTNNTQVFTEPWVTMMPNYNQKPPAWMKRKKKKVDKKKKTKQKKKPNNSDSCNDTVDKICELLNVYFQLQNYLDLIFFSNPLFWRIKGGDLIKFGLSIVTGSISEFKFLMLQFYLNKEKKYSKKKVCICDSFINLAVDVIHSIGRYFIAASNETVKFQNFLENIELTTLEFMNLKDFKNKFVPWIENSRNICSHIRNEFSNPIYPFESMRNANKMLSCPCLIPHYRSIPETTFLPVVTIQIVVKEISVVLSKTLFRNRQKNKDLFCRDFYRYSYLAMSSVSCKKINSEYVNKSFWLNVFNVNYMNSCIKHNVYINVVNRYLHRFELAVESSPKCSLLWSIDTSNMICFANCGNVLSFWYKEKNRWNVDEFCLALNCCRHKNVGICSKCGKWDFFAEVTNHEKCSPLSMGDHLVDPLFKAAVREVKLKNHVSSAKDVGSGEKNSKKLVHRLKKNFWKTAKRIANIEQSNNVSSDENSSANKVIQNNTTLVEDLKCTDKTCLLQ